MALAPPVRKPSLNGETHFRPCTGEASGARRSHTISASRSKRRSRGRRTIETWFASHGYKPFPFQKEVWDAYAAGRSGLLHASTGSGKTYAVWLGPVIDWLDGWSGEMPAGKEKSEPLKVLWLTPLRALALDTHQALKRPIEELALPWSVETRTGDTSSSVRNRQRERLPTALITTPESLSLLLSRPDSREKFATLEAIVVDEWHELLASKRGVQAELCLARLKRWRPGVRIWGLSATLGNLHEAARILLGPDAIVEDDEEVAEPSETAQAIETAAETDAATPRRAVLVHGRVKKKLVIDSIIPETMERFPWAGHLGIKLLEEVVAAIDEAGTSLVFTNTRSQTEIWYQQILARRPDWAGRLALHHGSLDPEVREWVEAGLRAGTLKAVVCTSSLDLGVDFSPVERVLQIGSPKGVARLVQRAGRSGHRPGAVSRVTCVPTHALELIETAATRTAALAGKLEGRQGVRAPFDVLAQHLVTLAVGEGFDEEEAFAEVRSTWSYRDLTREEWDWVLSFLVTGGSALAAYPEYRKLVLRDGRFVVDDPQVAKRHRLSIGTIVSDAALTVLFVSGKRLGTVEESFVSKLKPGDKFTFAGRALELAYVRDMKVYVRAAKGNSSFVPRWMGGRMPLSSQLAAAMRDLLELARQGIFAEPEMRAVRPLLELQAEWSAIPGTGQLLIERTESREGFHLFVYPFAGRLVHEGLAALLAYRLSRIRPITFTMSANDYGMELLSDQDPPVEEALAGGWFRGDELDADLRGSLNETEMAKRQFREVARIAGLVFQGYPGTRMTSRQMQASTGLLFDVFSNYDPDNLLLKQSRKEVMEQQLERSRLAGTLTEMREAKILLRNPPRFSPLSFPLTVDRLREKLSSEKLIDRVRRMQLALEKAAGPDSSRSRRMRPR